MTSRQGMGKPITFFYSVGCQIFFYVAKFFGQPSSPVRKPCEDCLFSNLRLRAERDIPVRHLRYLFFYRNRSRNFCWSYYLGPFSSFNNWDRKAHGIKKEIYNTWRSFVYGFCTAKVYGSRGLMTE